MEKIIETILEAIRKDDRPMRIVAAATGIQITRVHRIKAQGLDVKGSELAQLASFYGINPVEVAKKELIELNLAEAKKLVCDHYGVPCELLDWKLSAPAQRAMA